MSASVLNVRMALTLGAMPLDISFESDASWTVLFGPSGSGKTTVMRAIAGLAKPRTGRISFRGGDLFDSNTQPRRSVERVAAELKRLGAAKIRTVVIPGRRSPAAWREPREPAFVDPGLTRCAPGLSIAYSPADPGR